MGKAAQRKALRQNLGHLIDKAAKRIVAEGHVRQSMRQEHAQSRFTEAPADKRSNLENWDGFAALRNSLRRVSSERQFYAGIPMPLDGEQLIIEPTYPHAEGLMAIGAKTRDQVDADADEFKGAKVRNRFWSSHKRQRIVVFEHAGRILWGLDVVHARGLGFALKTLGAADAWGIEQESAAVNTLASLVSHRQFKQYMLTGMFLEISKRSGITYLFRRLRPTVAITPNGRHLREPSLEILCTLCLHPIGYYAGSYAGAMVPTDDLIAHLMLMRGDEKMFWKRANQHPAWSPEAGI